MRALGTKFSDLQDVMLQKFYLRSLEFPYTLDAQKHETSLDRRAVNKLKPSRLNHEPKASLVRKDNNLTLYKT